MKKTDSCLTCKYEPEWGDSVGIGDARRTAGRCKKQLDLPDTFPAAYTLTMKSIVMYSNGDGVFSKDNCTAWEPKDN